MTLHFRLLCSCKVYKGSAPIKSGNDDVGEDLDEDGMLPIVEVGIIMPKKTEQVPTGFEVVRQQQLRDSASSLFEVVVASLTLTARFVTGKQSLLPTEFF